MAHELDIRDNGEYSFVSLRETAWHKNGTIMQDEMSVDEAMDLAGHNFTVEKRPMFTTDKDGNNLPTSAFATVRTDRDKVLGVVSGSYSVFPNRKMWRTVEPLIEAGLARIETAGTIKEGKDVWATIQFATPAEDGAKMGFEDGERIALYGTITNNHAGERGVVTMLSPVRVVCNNTLTMALRSTKAGVDKVRTRHSGDVEGKVDETSAKLFYSALAQWTANLEFFAALKNITLTNETFAERVLDVILPLGETTSVRLKTEYDKQMCRRATLKRFWLMGTGHQGNMSAYEALNGVCEALDHEPETFIGRKTSTWNWTESALYGSTAKMKADITKSLMTLV
jgi:phage/plasmid-like protein (TIGR03299 family)